MNLLDLALLIWLGYYLIRGVFGGLVRMSLELLGLLVGIYVASRFYEQLATLALPLFFGVRDLARIVSFLIIFGAVYQLFAYAIGWLDRTHWRTHPFPVVDTIRMGCGGVIERGGGLIAGLVKGNIVIGLWLTLLTLFPLADWLNQLLCTSLFARYMMRWAALVVANLPATMAECLRRGG